MKEMVVKALSVTGLSVKEIDTLVEVPKEKSRGDYAFPCFVLAKTMQKNPVLIASELASKITPSGAISSIEATGPYINFFLDSSFLADKTLTTILKQKDKYGSKKGNKKKVIIEFSQANTHKAFHVGHIRGTSLGESLARVLSFTGDVVKRANYQGDTGMHVAKWLWCYTSFHNNEEIKQDEAWFAHIYVEAVKKLAENPDYTKEVEEINKKLDEKKDKELIALWKKTRKVCLDSLETIYKQLDTHFDYYFFESEVEQRGKELAKELVKKGIAEISDGATIVDFKKQGFPELGVWVLLRSDGTVLYSSKDIGLAERKFKELKIDSSVIITSVEQNLHFRQLQKTLELMKVEKWKDYHHFGYESIRLPTGKMSSRTGENVLYSSFRNELIEQARDEILQRFPDIFQKELEKRADAIALAAMKYTLLKQDINKIIIFDKKEALRFEGDTGPYLLYSYARAKNILRKASKVKKKDKTIGEHERKLVTELARFPDVVHSAVENYSPSVIAHYAYTLAQHFNEFYHACQVIGSDQEEFRLKLVEAFTLVLSNALNLLGITPLEEM